MNAFGDTILGFSVFLVAGFWVSSAVVAQSFASERGRAGAGFLLGLAYGPLSEIMALHVEPSDRTVHRLRARLAGILK